jgi:signal transduction histidine kinase
MRQRLAEIAGRCEIQSAPNAGTKVRFTVPFKGDPAA